MGHCLQISVFLTNQKLEFLLVASSMWEYKYFQKLLKWSLLVYFLFHFLFEIMHLFYCFEIFTSLSLTIMKKAFLIIAFLNYTKWSGESLYLIHWIWWFHSERSMAVAKDKCVATPKTRVTNCLASCLSLELPNCVGGWSSVLYLNEMTYLLKHIQKWKQKSADRKSSNDRFPPNVDA